MDLECHTEVSAAADAFHFAYPLSGRSIRDLSALRSMLVVRAGQDAMPGLNSSLDRFVSAGLSVSLSLVSYDHASGPHSFDTDANSEASRAVITGVVSYFDSNLLNR